MTYGAGMTYPEPVYLGDGGEASATYRPADTKPEITFASGATLSYVAFFVEHDNIWV